MARVLIVGAGGVATVAAHKCAQSPDVFSEIYLVSRTQSKCKDIEKSVLEKTGKVINTRVIDVTKQNLAAFIESIKPEVVINLASPWLDLVIMDACLEAGTSYIDTANWEPHDGSSFSQETGTLFRYEEQWAMKEAFKKAGLMAVIGAGYDPGVTQAVVAYALKRYFREINILEILDCNAGDHGKPFATNFDPETNIREVLAPGQYWEKGEWVKIDPIVLPEGPRMNFHQPFNFLDAGPGRDPITKEGYVLYHEELQSLVRHIPGLQRARFWMTFSINYLRHLWAFNNIGLTGIDPVWTKDKNGKEVEVEPLQFLKTLLPEPASLGPNYKGKTHIGCYMKGVGKDGKPREVYIYNVKGFEDCYKETGSQAISYTAGAPPVLAAELMITGIWKKEAGVFNLEQLDPTPFIGGLYRYGLEQKILVDREVPRFKWKW